jgi:hypothetical protein
MCAILSSQLKFRMTRSSWIVLYLSSLVVISTGCGGSAGQSATPTPTPVANAITIAFPAPTPVAVAEKIGTGNWTATSLPGNTSLVIQLPSGTTQYGIAFICTSIQSGAQVNSEWIIEADLKDGSSFSPQVCNPNNPTPPTGSYTGTFDATAFPATATVDISLNNFSRGALFNTTTGSFNITAALSGTTDVYATAFDSSHNLVAMKIVRSQTVPGAANGGNTITLAASDAVTMQPFSLVNIPAGGFSAPVMLFPNYVTANGSFAVSLGFPQSSQYAVASATEAQPGDYYFFSVVADAANQGVVTKQYLKAAGPVTLAFPNPWAPTPPTPAIFPTFTFDYTGLANQAAVADNAAISWTQGTTLFGINLVATANHQNGVTTVAIPDLTSLPGFFSMAPAGTTIDWGATTWGGTAQFYLGTTVIPQTISSASGDGTYTQP